MGLGSELAWRALLGARSRGRSITRRCCRWAARVPCQGSLGGIGWCVELAWGVPDGKRRCRDARTPGGPGRPLMLSNGSQATLAAFSPAFRKVNREVR